MNYLKSENISYEQTRETIIKFYSQAKREKIINDNINVKPDIIGFELSSYEYGTEDLKNLMVLLNQYDILDPYVDMIDVCIRFEVEHTIKTGKYEGMVI